MSTPRQTPLTQEHEKLGAKMVEFAGWRMPVEYQGLRQEHVNTRQNVGLFDVSHMGEVRVLGPKSLETLQWLTSNDVSRLTAGHAQYNLLTNEGGGIVDDIIVYCIKPAADYLVCVNASNTDKDFSWMVSHNRGAEIRNESSNWGQIAVQGPKAIALLEKIFGSSVSELGFFHFAEFSYASGKVFVARTGYTGEDGAEVFVPSALTAKLWQDLLKHGQEFSVQPVGLGARDTLRTEACLPLYGHEIDDTTNPYAAGLGWVVKPQVKDFLGRGPILQQKELGLKKKLVCFRMIEKGIPRAHYSLFSFDNKEIGTVTSGTVSPTLNENIGIGYVDVAFSEIGKELAVDIRGRKVKAVVVAAPFVAKKRSK